MLDDLHYLDPKLQYQQAETPHVFPAMEDCIQTEEIREILEIPTPASHGRLTTLIEHDLDGGNEKKFPTVDEREVVIRAGQNVNGPFFEVTVSEVPGTDQRFGFLRNKKQVSKGRERTTITLYQKHGGWHVSRDGCSHIHCGKDYTSESNRYVVRGYVKGAKEPASPETAWQCACAEFREMARVLQQAREMAFDREARRIHDSAQSKNH